MAGKHRDEFKRDAVQLTQTGGLTRRPPVSGSI